jgi:hypothetical protein
MADDDKLTEADKIALRRLLTAAKTWWHAPIGLDAIDLDELVEAFEEAREKLD